MILVVGAGCLVAGFVIGVAGMIGLAWGYSGDVDQ